MESQHVNILLDVVQSLDPSSAEFDVVGVCREWKKRVAATYAADGRQPPEYFRRPDMFYIKDVDMLFATGNKIIYDKAASLFQDWGDRRYAGCYSSAMLVGAAMVNDVAVIENFMMNDENTVLELELQELLIYIVNSRKHDLLRLFLKYATRKIKLHDYYDDVFDSNYVSDAVADFIQKSDGRGKRQFAMLAAGLEEALSIGDEVAVKLLKPLCPPFRSWEFTDYLVVEWDEAFLRIASRLPKYGTRKFDWDVCDGDFLKYTLDWATRAVSNAAVCQRKLLPRLVLSLVAHEKQNVARGVIGHFAVKDDMSWMKDFLPLCVSMEQYRESFMNGTLGSLGSKNFDLVAFLEPSTFKRDHLAVGKMLIEYAAANPSKAYPGNAGLMLFSYTIENPESESHREFHNLKTQCPGEYAVLCGSFDLVDAVIEAGLANRGMLFRVAAAVGFKPMIEHLCDAATGKPVRDMTWSYELKPMTEDDFLDLPECDASDDKKLVTGGTYSDFSWDSDSDDDWTFA